jgi:phospholipid transport system transporter-binding protein
VSEQVESVLQVSGRLTIDTATAQFNKGLQLTEGTELVIDFAKVEAVDSSAVSLMLAWLRSAQRKKVKLSFINVPDNLRSLANLYGVAESLSLSADA